MNREGYHDPTAERAVGNVSKTEVTRRKLITHCRSRPDSHDCGRCRYDPECNAFIKETGHVPYTCDVGEYDDEYLDTVIRPRRRRR